MALGKAGADRQLMHERLRQHAMAAWDALQAGEANPLLADIASDPVLQEYLSEGALIGLMDVRGYLGDAPQRARHFAARLRQSLLSC
jgi:adenylosuccinate lyase